MKRMDLTREVIDKAQTGTQCGIYKVPRELRIFYGERVIMLLRLMKICTNVIEPCQTSVKDSITRLNLSSIFCFSVRLQKQFGERSLFHYYPSNIGFSSFFNWWIEINENFPKFGSFSATSSAAWICWEIWRSRNLRMFEGINSDPIKIWNDAWRNFSVFLHVEENARSHSTPRISASSWNPPPHGFIKINVDAAFDQCSKTASLTAVA
ncbi:hypothetical protein GOBAR_DD12594 [Gossypium barbadense]|nr:hypothetical protein GOBAR_DD12594 [Gossypium barbadense]